MTSFIIQLIMVAKYFADCDTCVNLRCAVKSIDSDIGLYVETYAVVHRLSNPCPDSSNV